MAEENGKKFDLEERLIEFGALIVELVEELPNNKVGNYIAGQLIRSGLSPALNYGEAQSAESRADFIHKLKIILKELRESFISLKVIKRLKLTKTPDRLERVMNETQQLIAIFVKSIKTAQKNKK